MMAGFLYDTLRALDRWVILSFLGAVQVGYYTLTILVLQAITLLPGVVTSQFYPRISKRFGETHSYSALKPLLLTTLKASSALILPFGLVVFFLVRPLTQWLLPAYVEGIDAALIVTVGVTLSRPLAGTAVSFLNAVGKASLYMRVQVVMIFLQLGLTIGAALLGWGLNGIAWGVTVTQIVNMLSLTGIVIYLMKSESRPNKDI
jgi:O-antigen/teichoic acid export membrane protein